MNSPSWKPVLKLGYWWLQEGGRQPIRQAAWTHCWQALSNIVSIYRSSWTQLCSWHWHSSSWWWSWHQLPWLTAAPPPRDTDKSGGTLCQTDLVALSTPSSDEERMLREKLNRLTPENCQKKKKGERRNWYWDFQISQRYSAVFYRTDRFPVLSALIYLLTRGLPSPHFKVLW